MTRVRSLRRWVLVPIAIACLAVAALASRESAMGGGPLVPDLDLMTPLEVIGYVGIGVGLVLLPWVMVARARYRLSDRLARARSSESPRLPWWARVLGLALVAALVLVLGATVGAYLQSLIGSSGADPGTAGGDGRAASPDPLVGERPMTALVIASAILLILAVVAVALAIAWRRADAADADAPESPAASGVHEAVELSLDALRAEPDPRRAVIAAYAAMEAAMGRVGLGRDRSEAPAEYLQRILTGAASAGSVAAVAGDAASISELYQVAKFSAHPVDEPMRQAAIAALERIRSAVSSSRADDGAGIPSRVPAT